MEETAETREDAPWVNVDLKTVVTVALAALEAHADQINALNVYPVPDGDTGTNMLLTLRAVLEEVSASPHLRGEEAARAASRAALMGARGNSGVILSQILRGACEVLGEARALDAETIAAVLAGAKERAYSTVAQPVEGTMLSVIKDAASAARRCAERGEKDLLEVLRDAAREAHASVKRTPELLAVLKEAGVVDAGGLGVAVILDGILAALQGEELVATLEEAEPAVGGASLRDTAAHAAEEAWGYCTEFIVDGFSGDEGEFEAHIRRIGESVLVVPDADLVKVHLHTQDPGSALTYAGGFGRLSGVKVDDMEAQTRARAGSTPYSPRKSVSSPAVVSASRGAGNRELFESMGVMVVEGGQGANPSAEDFVRAVEDSEATAVVLLPNNKNVVPAAELARELAGGAEVHVVPTTSIAGGLVTVVLGYDAEDDEREPGEVVEEMRDIHEGLRCAEVTRAVRNARVEGREVREGSYIGLLDGKLFAVEASAHAVALALAGAMVEEGAEVLTLLWGSDMAASDAEEIAAAISGMNDDIVVETRDGGQPLYPLQMVAE